METTNLKPLFEAPGPFVTVHADVSRDVSDPGGQIQTRWTNIRHELERHEVPEELVEEVGRRLQEPTHLAGEVRRTLVLRGGEIVLDDTRSGHTGWPEGVTAGPFPDLAGWLAQTEGAVPFVLAEVDRSGGDVAAYVGRGRPPKETSQVEGETYQLRKVPVGGWSHNRYQNRAENTWRDNAAAVAEEVEHLRRQHRPRLIVVAGDVRARTELVAAIGPPSEAEDLVVVELESGGRADGVSEETFWADVHEAVASVEARSQQDLVGRLEQGLAGVQPTAFGLEPVAEALAKAEVEVVVLDLAAAREQVIDPARFPGFPLPGALESAGPAPADQVLLTGATLTGSSVRLLPAGLVPRGDGIAATLRW